jgi:hypothetical protein
MKISSVLAIAALVLGMGVCAQASLITYDATADLYADVALAVPQNPHGVWSYGYRGATNATDLTKLDFLDTGGWNAGFFYGGQNAVPAVWINDTGTTQHFDGYLPITTDLVYLHPGGVNAGVAVLRWTAPEAGIVDISALFSTSSTSATVGASLVKDGMAITSGSIVGGTTNTFDASMSGLAVIAGTKLDFCIDDGGNGYGNDMSSLDLTVTLSIPEPATLSLLALGAIGLVVYAWRKRR